MLFYVNYIVYSSNYILYTVINKNHLGERMWYVVAMAQ